ncbi:hypothetical protein ACFL6U_19355 [Planctomycetota bacterium]
MKRMNAAVAIGLLILLALSVWSVSWGQVDTRRIDDVRSKSVLEASDLGIIDSFVREAVRELARTDDFANISKVRSTILSRTSNQGQYAQQFSESALKYIAQGFEQVARLPEEQRFMVELNLLILVDSLKNPALARLALPYAQSKKDPLRYWSIHTLANKQTAALINSGNAGPLGQQILQIANAATNDPANDIVGIIADFAVLLDGNQGQEILMQIADARIAQYKDGSVADELLDTRILKHLCSKITPNNASKTQIAQRFSQLYSQVIQRYAKNQATLSDPQKQRLVSVIVEIEEKCISSLLEPQKGLLRAIERSDVNGLMQEHDNLLGAGGSLSAKFGN